MESYRNSDYYHSQNKPIPATLSGLNREQIIITQPAAAGDSKIATCSSTSHTGSQTPSPWLLRQERLHISILCTQTFYGFTKFLVTQCSRSQMWSAFFNAPDSLRLNYFTQKTLNDLCKRPRNRNIPDHTYLFLRSRLFQSPTLRSL